MYLKPNHEIAFTLNTSIVNETNKQTNKKHQPLKGPLTSFSISFGDELSQIM